MSGEDGYTIAELRAALGLSARAFGVKCGLTDSKNTAKSVYRWEDGTITPSVASQRLMENLIKELEKHLEKK